MRIIFLIGFLLTSFFAQTQSKLNMKYIDQITSDVKNVYDFVQYGMDCADATEKGHPIPSPSFLDGNENLLLDMVINSLIKSLGRFNNEWRIDLPMTTVYDYSRSMSVRSDVHDVLFHKLDSLDTLSIEWAGYLRQSKEVLRDVQELKRMANSLGDRLLVLFDQTGGGITEVSSVFGFQAIKIKNRTSPQLSKIEMYLKEGIEIIKKRKTDVTQMRGVLLGNFSLILANQNTTLHDSLNFVKEEQELIEKRAKILHARTVICNKKIKVYHEKLDDLKGEKEVLSSLKAKILESKTKIRNYTNQISNKKSQISKLSYCENNKSWENCKHFPEKEVYKRTKESLEADIQFARNSRINAEEYVRVNSPLYGMRAKAYNDSIDYVRRYINELNGQKEKFVSQREQELAAFINVTSSINRYFRLIEICEGHLVKLSSY